jgi:PadR family transcriptional regulator PadR
MPSDDPRTVFTGPETVFLHSVFAGPIAFGLTGPWGVTRLMARRSRERDAANRESAWTDGCGRIRQAFSWLDMLPLTFDVSCHIHTSASDWSDMARSPSIDLLQGTLDLLILKTLSWGPAHGYAVARWIEQLTGNVLTVGEGSLYPALHRLEEREWIEAEWRVSEHNRRAKFYRLTGRGRRQLRTETADWSQFVDAMAKVLRTTEQPA